MAIKTDGHRPAPQSAEELRRLVASLRSVGGVYRYVAAQLEADYAHLLESEEE